MTQALASSPSLGQAAARVRRARALAGVVEAAEAPQLELQASAQRQRWPDDYFYGPGVLGRTSSWNNSAQLGFSYDLDLWGRERSRSRQAIDQARQTVAEARLATLELQGKLLLIHGTDDATVVWQQSVNFIKKAVDENVQVDYFVYPGYEHNVRGKDRIHLMQKITDYFDTYLK